jgi:lipid-A-disaccharide synthase
MTSSSIPDAPTIMLVAGEASGDAHGAELILALRRRNPNLRFIGCGGSRMAAAGQEQLFDSTRHAVVGLTEVLRHFFTYRKYFFQLVTLAQIAKPQIVIFIDNSGFNLRLAASLRHKLLNSRFVYYISPQVWASRAGRVRSIQNNIDLVLSIFPFEADWYAEKAPGLPVHYVGHPMLDRIFEEAIGQTVPGRIALMPGSRTAEIKRHLPILWDAARIIADHHQGLKFVLISPDAQRERETLAWINEQGGIPFDFETCHNYQLTHLNRCELALVKSGTGSLHCAFARVPQIVIYKVNSLTYAIAKRLVKVKHISMVNVLAKKPPVVPELIQNDCNPVNIARCALDLLEHPKKRQAMIQNMMEVVATLGGPGASERAAREIFMELNALAKNQ